MRVWIGGVVGLAACVAEDTDVDGAACVSTSLSVDFGAARVADGPVVHELAVANVCEDGRPGVRALGLTATVDGAAFALAAPPEDVGPGESGVVRLTYTPHAADEDFGVLTLATTAPDRPSIDVDLSGAGIAGQLALSSAELAFGDVEVGCAPERSITVRNVGNEDLALTNIAVSSGPFTLVDAPSPGPLAPGAAAAVSVAFTPTAAAASATLTVSSDDPVVPSAAVPLSGAGVSPGSVVDRTTQGALAADVLLVVDNSGTSMVDPQAALAEHLDALLAGLGDGDWQIAVITTDKPTFRGDVVTPTTPDPVTALATQTLAGTFGSVDAGTAQVLAACGPGGDAAPGGGFLREDARLTVVVVSTASDDSAGSPEAAAAALVDVKGGDAELVRYHAIVGDVPTPPCRVQPGTGYVDVAAETGGAFVSVCTTDWATDLAHLGAEAVGLRRAFRLTSAPVPASIAVTVDGAGATGWTYDGVANEVRLPTAPPAGATVEVAYDVAPTCP